MKKKFKGFGIVWDAERNAPLCEFMKDDSIIEDIGVFVTDDERTIGILEKLEYKSEEITQEDKKKG